MVPIYPEMLKMYYWNQFSFYLPVFCEAKLILPRHQISALRRVQVLVSIVLIFKRNLKAFNYYVKAFIVNQFFD